MKLCLCFAIPIIIVLSLSCQSNAVAPIVATTYPLGKGNAWTYDLLLEEFNFRPAFAGATYALHRLTGESMVEVADTATLRDSLHTWKLGISEQFQGFQASSATSYYLFRGDTLLLIGYVHTNLSAPKSPSGFRYRFGNEEYRSLDEFTRRYQPESSRQLSSVPDSIMYEDRPPRVLVFPLQVGSQWVYRERNFPFYISRRISGIDTVMNSMAPTWTFKVEYQWDIGNDGMIDTDIQGFDYVSNQGLLRRSFLYKDIRVVLSSPDSIIGTVDLREERRLKSTNVR